MKEYVRNLAVGMTVIVALALLAGMILLFTGLPEVFQRGYEVYISADSTHDAHEGDPVHLAGMLVGRITDISFTDPAEPYRGVTFTAKIEHDVDLPGNVRAYFFTKGFVGAAYLELKSTGPQRIDPATGRPLERFPRDGSIIMDSVHVGGSMVPQELTDALKGLSRLADNLNALIAPESQAAPAVGQAPGPATRPAVAQTGLRGTLARLNRTLDALTAVMGDLENQRNIKTSLANLATATSAATGAMDSLKKFADEARATAVQARATVKSFTKLAETSRKRIDELAEKIIADAEAVSKVMATINRAASKIDAGEGTAGKLINDPKLYDSLLDATRQMEQLLVELRELVEIWKTGGIKVKLP